MHSKILKININDKMRNTENMQLKSTYKIQNKNNDLAYGFVTFRENFNFTDSRIFTVRRCYHFRWMLLYFFLPKFVVFLRSPYILFSIFYFLYLFVWLVSDLKHDIQNTKHKIRNTFKCSSEWRTRMCVSLYHWTNVNVFIFLINDRSKYESLDKCY